ncbi:MAG: glutamate--cysteine ligase [Alphaproteobacteria bacterium]|nr:glutamate--cysteine ligase [Alphaproteobacteria bacterium]
MTLTRDGLIAAYETYGKPDARWRVGAEFERHLLDADGIPLPYYGEPGVRWLMMRFAANGWEPTMEGEHPIALSRGQARITLEPGGQYELSGAPHDDVSGVDAELAAFNAEVDGFLEGTGYRQVALGFTPFARIEDIPWVPKGRYSVMREHLKETGKLAHHMMKGTCATQASYDFRDEADCGRKVRLATRLGPLTTAIFANSPIAEGRDTGWASYRGHIWTQTDPRRTGFPEAATDFTYEKWVDYLLDVPMMFIKRGGTYHWAHGRTFRDWMTDADDPPTVDDWDLHLTSVFPEVRIKQTIEVRGADCVPRPLAMSFTALFEGLFYCGQARDEAEALTERFVAHGDKDERFEIACRTGLRGELGGRPLAAWAEELLDIAGSSLDRCRPGDRRWLAPLVELVERGECPADGVRRAFREDPGPGVLARFHVDRLPG